MRTQRLAILMFLAAIPATAASAQQFARHPALRLEPGESLLAPIDLDGDGDDDLAAITPSRGILTPMLANGTGTFERATPVAVPGIVRPILGTGAVSDVDRDGDLDLVTTLSPTGAIVLRNTAGRLTPAGAIPALAATRPTLLRLRDLDGDGAPDLAVLVSGTISLLRNDGTGAFVAGSWTTPLRIVSPLDVAFGDFDGDGADDLAMAGPTATVLWMRRGNAFVDESATRLPLGTMRSGLTLFDLDQDGDLDIAGTSLGTAGHWLLRNDGTGNFTDSSSLLASGPTPVALGAHAVDADGDGVTDLVLGGTVLIGRAGAAFVRRESVALAIIASCDVHGDGRRDLFSIGGLATNVLGQRFELAARGTAAFPADLDGDGDPDLISTALPFSRTEAGRSTPFGSLPSATPQSARAVADFDGDGDLDVLAAITSDLHASVNDGFGNLTLGAMLPLGLGATAILPFDRDRDGDIDILVLASNGIALLDNRGAWTFADVAATDLPRRDPMLDGADVGDVDGDGDLDVLLGGRESPNAMLPTLLFNQGNGVFVDAGTAYVAPNDARRGRFAQLDGDRELEIVMFSPVVRVFDRILGVWQDVSASRLPTTIAAARVLPVDFDDDGDTDLVAEGGFAFRNDGRGRLADVPQALGPFPTTILGAVDFDGDGDQDLLDGDTIWLNGQRQLQLASRARPGGSLRLEFVGERGFGTAVVIALPILGIARSARGVGALGGTLFVEPTTTFPGPALVSAGGQVAGAAVAIPAQPALRGLTLQIQGLVVTSNGRLALANHLTTTID
ncbi:MAG: VCBS repeat-containing protein [Planctomycetes bacterium]|nr:VCBS repeat-containing protein [Planctomycetota bacterium]